MPRSSSLPGESRLSSSGRLGGEGQPFVEGSQLTILARYHRRVFALFAGNLQQFLRLIRRSYRKPLRRGHLVGEHWPWLRAYRTARLRQRIIRGEFAGREILAVSVE